MQSDGLFEDLEPGPGTYDIGQSFGWELGAVGRKRNTMRGVYSIAIYWIVIWNKHMATVLVTVNRLGRQQLSQNFSEPSAPLIAKHGKAACLNPDVLHSHATHVKKMLMVTIQLALYKNHDVFSIIYITN